MRLEDIVVLVTGGASGIGEAIARILISKKSKVVICDLQEEKGKKLESEFSGKLTFIKCDITNEKETENMIDTIEKNFGRLDAVINSAGVVHGELIASEKGYHSSESFKKMMRVNTFGSFNVSRFAARLMAKNAKPENDCNGSIVFLASIAGFEGQKGQTAYSASKGALIGMTLPMARDLGKYKIRVNAVAPGLIVTPMTGKMNESKNGKAIIEATPLKRLCKPEEAADACLFCITNDFLNGTTIRIDGGVRFPHF